MRAGGRWEPPRGAATNDKLSHRGCGTVPGTTTSWNHNKSEARIRARARGSLFVYGCTMIFVTYDRPTQLQRIVLRILRHMGGRCPLRQLLSRRRMKKDRQTRRRMVLCLLSIK